MAENKAVTAAPDTQYPIPNPQHPISNIQYLRPGADDALRLEWLVTNGIGGYASASLSGANTRRYHGLLVAALNAPVGRAVLLSRFNETLTLAAANTTRYFPLATNLYPGAMQPQGYLTLESWDSAPAPRWVFAPLPNLRLQKTVYMAAGENVTYIAYTLLESPENAAVALDLVPLLAWKDYHSEMHAGAAPRSIAWEGAKLRVLLPGVWNVAPDPFPLTLSVLREDGTPFAGADFDSAPDWYYRFQHPREQERGQNFEEDLFAPGTLKIPLRPGETVVLAATIHDAVPTVPQIVWQTLLVRQVEAVQSAGTDAFAQSLALSAADFRVSVPGKRSTIIAGYPWFSDWGRDTMIALPGVCLTTGQTDMAREILLSFAAVISEGMLPNRFPDAGETPDYNTADATLWYFAAIYRYIMATNDLEILRKTLWPALETIVTAHFAGTRYDIHVDMADGLLHAGQPGVQLTWMDAKVGDWVVTPRIGKAVEINALWANALATMADFAERMGDTRKSNYYGVLSEKTAQSFQARFLRPDGKGLYDVLDAPPDNAPDPAIRPNQIFALSLPFAPIAPASPLAETILQTIETELLTPVGLRTLAPSDPAYRPRYEGDQRSRDGAYHQGTVWPWLLGPFAEALYKTRGDKAAALALLTPLQAHLREYGLGSLAEIYDGDAPQRPNGCNAQAWSVGEILRVLQLLRESVSGR